MERDQQAVERASVNASALLDATTVQRSPTQRSGRACHPRRCFGSLACTTRSLESNRCRGIADVCDGIVGFGCVCDRESRHGNDIWAVGVIRRCRH